MDDHQKNLSRRSASPSKNALPIKLRTYSHGGAQDLITSLEEDGLLYNHHNKHNRICKVCKKGFSSGRALGGHMRVHAQAQGQEQLQLQQQLHLHLQVVDGDPATSHILPIPNTNNNTPIIPKLKLISKSHHHHRHGNYKRAGIGNSATAAAGGPLNVKSNANPSTSTTKTNINSSNPICSLCGKKFPSMKSLFGHMRCHPEREWRGIQPPPPPPSPPPLVAAPKNTSVSSSTVSDKDSCVGHDHGHNHHDDQRGKIEIEVDDRQLDSSLSTTALSAVNLAESLSSWSVTAKRGRKAIAAVPPPRASASASPSDEMEPIPEKDAAYHLMMLAHGNSLGECFPSRSYSNSNLKQQPQTSVPCFRPRNGIGNTQNLGDLAKKQRGGDDGSQSESQSHSQSQSSGSQNREYIPFSKKLKIDVASSLNLTSSCSRRDEEQLETSKIVRYDDSIQSKSLKLKADKEHGGFAPNFDFDPVVEQMDMYRKSTTFTWDSFAGGGLVQGSRRQSSGEEEDREELDSRTTDDDSSDGDQRDQPDELTCISEMILSQQKLNKQKRGRKKKKMKLRDLERMGPNPIKCKKQHKAKITRATASLSDRFKCWTCNKTFSSHQALGGHRSSHKLGKNSQSIPIPQITTFTTTAGMDDHPISRREEEELQSQSECVTHRCKICNKAFPTGQALGGHQRLHWTSPAECAAAAPSSSVASREDIYISKAGDGRGMLEFDLNKMPEGSMEEDNEGVESVCCTRSPYHASSSYNSIT